MVWVVDAGAVACVAVAVGGSVGADVGVDSTGACTVGSLGGSVDVAGLDGITGAGSLTGASETAVVGEAAPDVPGKGNTATTVTWDSTAAEVEGAERSALEVTVMDCTT